MSLLSEIKAEIGSAISKGMHPAAILVSPRGLIQIAEALRRNDAERRDFRIAVIDGAPHVWSPFQKKYVPIRPAHYYYEDTKYSLKIPFRESPIMLDDKFLIDYTSDPLPRRKFKDPDAWRYSDQPMDTVIG